MSQFMDPKAVNDAFFQAIDENNISAVRQMLTGENGHIKVSPNIRDAVGQTPLGWAAFVERSEICRLLIDHGAVVNETNRAALNTPLIGAVRSGNHDIVRLLLENKADPNIKNKRGLTALHEMIYVAMAEKERMFKILISFGADPMIENTAGQNFFDAMASNGDRKRVSFFREIWENCLTEKRDEQARSVHANNIKKLDLILNRKRRL